MKENIKNKNKKMDFLEEKKQIQALLDKYLAGETSNEEEETLRNYFEEHGDDIPEEWKAFRALFSFVGFEKLKFLDSEEDISEDNFSEEEPISEEKTSSEEKSIESDKPQLRAKQSSLRRYLAISAAAAIALILTITGIRSISNHPWGDTQPECYAVIDGKVYTNPQKVHDEALDALQDIGPEGQDDAFEALEMIK